ncbi:hypothetical protein CDD82_5064 [Ophiocordyceps australis]|uniref:Aflatoxin regulatory protein domain-containing protein n=1 Tax=Ophiocordyceps australis TaxID=1399860 RepID=A0A2C5Y4A9_9HYPO|nr:hypothetical protein CDD82_5064 [Ophiocordyceps australis]
MIAKPNQHLHREARHRVLVPKAKCNGQSKACCRSLEQHQEARAIRKRPWNNKHQGEKMALRPPASGPPLYQGRDESHHDHALGLDSPVEEPLGSGQDSSLVLDPPPPWMHDVYQDFLGPCHDAQTRPQEPLGVNSERDLTMATYKVEADLEPPKFYDDEAAMLCNKDAGFDAVFFNEEKQSPDWRSSDALDPSSSSPLDSSVSPASDTLALSRQSSSTLDNDLSHWPICSCAADMAQCLDHLVAKDATSTNTMSLVRRLEMGAMACRRASECTVCTACADNGMLLVHLVQHLSKISVELVHKALANTLDDDEQTILICAGRCGIERSKLKVMLIYNAIMSDLFYLQDSLRLVELRLVPSSVTWTIIHAELLKLAIATSPL